MRDPLLMAFGAVLCICSGVFTAVVILTSVALFRLVMFGEVPR